MTNNKKWQLFPAFICLVIVSLAALSGRVFAADNGPTNHRVEITQFKFGPKKLEVKPGDTVTWINRDLAPHTATASDKSWTSPQLKFNEEWTLTVTTETSADYFCKYHPRMKATFTLKN